MVGEDNMPFPADGFRLTYVPTQGGLGISTEKPVNAGTFKVRVTRPADDIYAAFEAEYEGVLKINKATRSAEELSLDESKTKTGHNFLVIGFNKIEDLHANAKTTISVSGGGTGLSLEKGRVLFSNLPANRRYSISIQITGDPNYEDFAQTLPETADLSTQAVPTSLPGASDVDKAWYNGSSNLYLSTAAQMFGFAELIRGGESFAGKTVTLLCDVDLGTFRWDTGNREFKGTFDGGGHAIYGISVSGAKANAGLFDLLGSGAVVRNVCLIGGSVFSNAGSLSYGHVGGIAGYALNGSTILSCTNYAAISGTGGGDNGGFGGIVGAVSYDQNGAGANVKNCVNYGSVSGSPYHIGGIVGYHLGTSTIANCANYGPVNGATCTGGIVGETYNASSVVYNCVNGGMVTGGGSYRGAIVGRNNENDGHVEQCYYLAGSAPGRSSSGSKDGAEPDIMENLKCSAFQSYTSIPALVVEEGCGGLPLLDVLNAWARRCGYVSWNWDANGYPVPESAPRG